MRKPPPVGLISPIFIAVSLAISGCGSSGGDDEQSTPSNDPVVPLVVSDTTDETGDDTAIVPNDPAVPQDDVAALEVDGNAGTYYLGAPPTAIGTLTLDPLSVDAANSSVIPGGSIRIPVTASAPFSTLYVVADEEGSDAAGYFEILLPAAVTAAELLVTYQSVLQADSTQQVDVQVSSADGSVSATNSASLQTVSVATGDLQVSVSWDAETDVDLSLMEPGGETISFSNLVSEAGGELDLDSNPLCLIDGIKNENISYAGVTPPIGTYTVVVDYFSDCGLGDTNYVVTVQNAGVISTFRGTLNDESRTEDVTTFEVR